jgi:hypothetical protein
MGDESSDTGARELRFEQRLAAAVRKRQERHRVPVPANLTSTVMAAVRHSVRPVPAFVPVPWWKQAAVFVGGILIATAAALLSWWIAVTRIYPALVDRLEGFETMTASLASPLDFLYDLYATTPVTDFVAIAFALATVALLVAFRLSPLDD